MRCRKTSRTDGNATSSRSHAVFQVTLKSKLPGEEGVKRMPSRLALVDLAGSERGADRGNSWTNGSGGRAPRSTNRCSPSRNASARCPSGAA